MLDADEASGFDEAMRQAPELRDAYREMNSLSAAVAAASVAPLPPRAGQLERLQARLGLQPSKTVNWLGISGWAAAAAVTFILLVDRKSPASSDSVENHPTRKEARIIPKVPAQESPQISQEPGSEKLSARVNAATHESDVKMITKVEAQRLVQEIAALRTKLENVEKREQKRFEPVHGMAWPIVMTMRPPRDEVAFQSTDDPDASVVGVLGDALAGTSSLADSQVARGAPDSPSAVPIYDPATGKGTLVANNVSDGNLWYTTKEGGQPLLVGRLPQSTEASESIGFELPVATIPANFIITNDADGKDAPPSATNTILIGPQ
jgi:hypothetical protein